MVSQQTVPIRWPQFSRRSLKILALVCLGFFLSATPALAQDAASNPGLIEKILFQIQDLGPWGPIALIGVYIIATVAFISGGLLTLGAGALFGLGTGSLCAFIGASLGATAAFLVGRYLARDWVAKKIAGNKTFSAIDQAVGDEGFKIVSLTRLSPVFPFVLLNYAFGITSVSLRDYVLGFVGMIPGTFLYTYLGATAGNLAQAFAGGEGKSPAEYALFAVGLIATFVVTYVITGIAKKALNEKLVNEEPSTPDAPAEL
ncbi:MAG: TVP38/TMEM64 family protein [Leptolyngbyaceae bacterium]|nr:TVP38/TMEM64 family protein [Leptolyngbyaceae bacterium]